MSDEPGRFRVRAVPGARRTELVGPHGDAWKLRIHAPPERGRANTELQRFVAELLGVRRDAISIDAGSSSRDKLVRVDGVDSDTIARMLASLSGK